MLLFPVGAATTVSIWSQIEAGLAIAAGSSATLRPLFKIMLRKIGVTTQTHSAPASPSYAYGRDSLGPQSKHTCAGADGHRSYITKSSTGPNAGRSIHSMRTFNRMRDAEEESIASTGHEEEERARGGSSSSVGSTADLYSKAGGPGEVVVILSPKLQGQE